jgi:hypothetical protein
MLSNKIQEVIKRLSEMTKDNKLTWEKTSRDSEYSCAFKSGKITIDLWSEPESPFTFCDFMIYNENGDQIEHLLFDKKENDYELLETLYLIVNRKYLKVDETIEGIIKELDDIEIPF